MGRADPFNTVDSTLDTDITAAYNELWAILERRLIAYWGSDEAVPDEFAQAVKYLLAFHYMPNVAVSDERERRILSYTGQDGEKGYNKLRVIASGRNPNEVVPGIFF